MSTNVRFQTQYEALRAALTSGRPVGPKRAPKPVSSKRQHMIGKSQWGRGVTRMAVIGYARTSRPDGDIGSQVAVLREAGAVRVFADVGESAGLSQHRHLRPDVTVGATGTR